MAELVNYTPPPHMDARALIQRAAAQLRAWHEKYGEHQPGWLPPAGDVRWLEDADAYLATHQLQQPAFVAGPGFPVSGVSTWRTGPTGTLVRVCEASDVECSRGCNVGPCAKRAAAVSGVETVAAPSEAGAVRSVLERAKAMYAQHPTYRGTKPLSWYDAPQAARREWLDKAKAEANAGAKGDGKC